MIQWQADAYVQRETQTCLLISRQETSITACHFICEMRILQELKQLQTVLSFFKYNLGKTRSKAPSFPSHWKIGPVANRDVALFAFIVAHSLSHTVYSKIINQQKRCFLSGVVLPFQDCQPLHYNKYVVQNLNSLTLSFPGNSRHLPFCVSLEN